MKLGIMDEPAFNIKFVEIVKRYPCLYDFTNADYSKREANDHAWGIVSSEMKMTVPQCKEKWRNLRTALSRSLKLKKVTASENAPNTSSGQKPKKNKEYYLKESMGFILPFLRSKGPTDTADSNENEIVAYDYSNESGEVYDPNCPDPNMYRNRLDPSQYDPRHFADCSPAEYSSSSSVGNPRKRPYEPSQDGDYSQCYEMPPNSTRIPTRADSDDANKLLSDCFEFMQTSVTQDNNPDLQFLKSLLPDISKMNDHQKRQFKKRTLDVIDSILCNSFTQIIDST